MVNVTQIFGIIASILSASLYIPQLIHMINLKSGKDISYVYSLYPSFIENEFSHKYLIAYSGIKTLTCYYEKISKRAHRQGCLCYY